MGGRHDRRAEKAAWYLAIVKHIGGIASMLCSGLMGVVWKELLMRHTVSF